MRMTDKVAIVTGAASGIGRAAVELLHAAGARVLATGTSAERLAQLELDLPGVVALANDAGDPAAADVLAAAVREHLGGLDGAFLNAGIGRFQPLAALDAETIDRHFAVNVRGPMLEAKALAPLLACGGALVLFERDMWRGPVWLNTAYGVILGLKRYGRADLAAELAWRLCTGVYRVFDRERRIYEFYDPDAHHTRDLHRKRGNRWKALTLGTGPQRDFVGWTGLVNNLLSFVTGSEYVVDGGSGRSAGGRHAKEGPQRAFSKPSAGCWRIGSTCRNGRRRWPWPRPCRAS